MIPILQDLDGSSVCKDKAEDIDVMAGDRDDQAASVVPVTG